MTENPKSKAWLENAYDLATPDDNRAYYEGFAEAYDAEFADALGYCYPQIIAQSYIREAGFGDAPVADIGCGTGLVAEGLPPGLSIDGFDISPQMLEKAGRKQLYKALHEIDITGELGPHKGRYGAVLSAGTFTHGHLGPEPLENLIGIGRKGALFVIGVNKAHFEAQGFGDVLERLVDADQISDFEMSETRIYDRKGHDHSDDLAFVLVFRRSVKRKS